MAKAADLSSQNVGVKPFVLLPVIEGQVLIYTKSDLWMIMLTNAWRSKKEREVSV